MITTTRASLATIVALCIALLAGASLPAGAVAAAGSSAVIAYQKEGFKVYEQQLAGGQIEAVTINKRLRSLRVTLKNGQHVLARYKPKGESSAAAALQAKGVPVTVLSTTEAASEKPAHHKLRYIVGAAVIVVLVIVATVLFVDRKRKRDRE